MLQFGIMALPPVEAMDDEEAYTLLSNLKSNYEEGKLKMETRAIPKLKRKVTI